MGTIVDAVAVETPSLLHLKRGAIDLAVRAARHCFDEAGVEPHEIDLLINAGIYREKHLGEPALAALIQDDLDLNDELQPDAETHGTFSFDVLNGVCGALSGFHLADTLIRAGTVNRAIVVAEDTKPEHLTDFPWAPAAGAALLSWSGEPVGFLAHRMETYIDGHDEFHSAVRWHPKEHHLPGRVRGHNTLTIERTDSFGRVACEAAGRSLRRFLDERGVTLTGDDCLVVAGLEEADRLVAAAGLGPCAIATVPPSVGALHTVAPLAALLAAREGGHLAHGDAVLVAVAAGITVGLTHYRAAAP
jgi:3-oxoacyl-[acyl-carrier-protein] synthase-3